MTDPNPVNYWTVRSEPALACWRARFPTTNAAQIDRLLDFVQGLIAAGERERIYRVLETRQPYRFRAADGTGTYDQFLRACWRERAVLPLFDFGTPFVIPTPEGDLRTPSEVCYFAADGQIASEWIEDAGELLERLRPADVGDGTLSYMQHLPPLLIEGQTLRADALPASTALTFTINTDLWFPVAFGLMEPDWPPDTPRGLYDNSALASCHTARLNAFLQTVREGAITLGGAWALLPAEGSALHFSDFVTENGIIL
jgi:hypothetical protein